MRAALRILADGMFYAGVVLLIGSTGAAAMLGVILIMASIEQEKAPNYVDRDAAKAGWGQSDGRVYRVTPAEVVPSQEPRP